MDILLIFTSERKRELSNVKSDKKRDRSPKVGVATSGAETGIQEQDQITPKEEERPIPPPRRKRKGRSMLVKQSSAEEVTSYLCIHFTNITSIYLFMCPFIYLMHP